MPVLRVLVEVLHIVAGVLAALLIGATAAWAYPMGSDSIWLTTKVSVGIIVLMGLKPLIRAIRGTPSND